MSELIEGCTNPAADNYNSSANTDDRSCYYILRHDGECHRFEDMPLPEDRSFTVSFSILGNCWVFFHDYLPDLYFHTRDKLWSVKDSVIRKHNDALPGLYDTALPDSFFIDLVFPASLDFITETATWLTETLNGTAEQMFGTFTHISLWNSYQHSGRIALSQVWESLQYTNIRRTQGEWVFNDFLNILQESPGDFLSSIFEDFRLSDASIDPLMSWYDRAPLEDRWVCLRLENDNTSGNTMLLHEVNITALKSDR